MKKEEDKQGGGLRSYARETAASGCSIEFKPSDNAMVYQFSLRDWSSHGLGILVRNDSKVLTHLKVGQIISFKMHRPGGDILKQPVDAEIRHISEPEKGQHPAHKIVGLEIVHPG